MQILPLVTARSQAATDGIVQSAAVASHQSAIFASLLDSARATTAARSGLASTGSSQKNTTSASSSTI